MRLPRHAELWLIPYLTGRIERLLQAPDKPTKIWLMIADHFEPLRGKASVDIAVERVQMWRRQWPKVASGAPVDCLGNTPQYTFFYPQEEYYPRLLKPLVEMVCEGLADIEVHIHHDREARDVFINRITEFCRILRSEYGLLHEKHGRVMFGFIHGNWALDNSLPQGKWCGLNDEITILKELGCYADFTMPSGDSPSQAHMVNCIYWCKDDPKAPKSYDYGEPVKIGCRSVGDLLMIPGPLGLRYRGRFLPRMETGEIAAYDRVSAYRVSRWIDLSPRISGSVFLKLYTHGAVDANASVLLQQDLARLFALVKREAERRRMQVVYATAWQVYQEISRLLNDVNV